MSPVCVPAPVRGLAWHDTKKGGGDAVIAAQNQPPRVAARLPQSPPAPYSQFWPVRFSYIGYGRGGVTLISVQPRLRCPVTDGLRD